MEKSMDTHLEIARNAVAKINSTRSTVTGKLTGEW
jgi:hypothetical protein